MVGKESQIFLNPQNHIKQPCKVGPEPIVSFWGTKGVAPINGRKQLGFNWGEKNPVGVYNSIYN